MENENQDNKIKFNLTIVYAVIIAIIVVIATMLVSYAFFNFNKTGGSNEFQTAQINFVFDDSQAGISIDNSTPVAQIDAGQPYECTFTLRGSSNLANGINYYIYAIPGANVSGKDRLLDSVMSLLFEPAQNADGYTTSVNNFSTAASPVMTDNKVLISSGVITNTNSSIPAKTYKVKLWIDENKILVSSTTKRANNLEGNPSLAVTTSGNVTANRYVRNDNTLEETTLYPATNAQSGKIVYTTNEFSHSYYNIKIVVETS